MDYFQLIRNMNVNRIIEPLLSFCDVVRQFFSYNRTTASTLLYTITRTWPEEILENILNRLDDDDWEIERFIASLPFVCKSYLADVSHVP